MPDGEGRVFSVGASSGQAPVTATLYNGFSQPMSITYGSADSDNLSYDPNTGRMLQYLAAINGAQTQKGGLYWNANGTLAQLLISDTFNSANSQICAYAHDDLTRLAQIDCGSGKWGQSFAYDTFGNISKTNLSGRTGINFLPTYSASTNHYSTLPAGTPAYDSNGNLTNDSYHTYAWDSDGNMATIGGTTALTYDALDRRVELAQSSTYTQTLYGPGGAKLALLNGANVAKVFLPLPGGATAVYTSSGLAYYRHPDWLGSSRLASTPSRTVYYDGAYAPYGENYAEAGTTDRNFTGQNQDTASDLYDFLYREYHPTQGRWIQPDPAGLAAVDISNPQSWNRYGYVANSPLVNIDPNGTNWLSDLVKSVWNYFSTGDSNGPYTFSVTGYGALPSEAGPGHLAPPNPGDQGGGVGGGGGSRQPTAPKSANKHYGLTTPCGSTASQVMGAVEGNFSHFGNYSAGPFSVSFSPPAGMGVGSTIPITVGAFGFTQNMGVSVASMSSQSMTFNTLPGGHLFYPGSISFAASPASAGSINFDINLSGTFNGATNAAKYYAGGALFENAQWNHFLGQVGAFCEVRH